MYYCERILNMSANERQNFLSSKEGELFKEKYKEKGYKYDERDVQAFCEDIKNISLKPDRKISSKGSSSRRSSSRSPRPCPESGFPAENRKLSYIRFEEEETNQYTEYIHKKYRNTTGRNPEDTGEAGR